MEYVIIAVVSIWAVEIFLRLPVRETVNDLLRVSKKAIHTVLSPHISDHWKEKVMLVYAKKSFTSTLKLAGIILIFLALVLIPVFAVDHFKLTNQSVFLLLGTAKGLTVSTVLAMSYFWLRSRLVK